MKNALSFLLAALVFAMPASGGGKQRCFVTIGDSLCNPPNSWVDDVPGWVSENVAQGGSMAAQWASTWTWPNHDFVPGNELLIERLDAVTCTPKVVVVMLGSNDSGWTQNGPVWPPSLYAFHMNVIVEEVRARWPKVRMMLFHPPAKHTPWVKRIGRYWLIRRTGDDYRAELEKLARDRTRVCIAGDFLPLVPFAPMPDNVHPGAEGQARMNRVLKARLRRWMTCY